MTYDFKTWWGLSAKDKTAELRRQASPPERTLANRLEGGILGFSCYWNHAVGPYFPDFYVPGVKLVVEVDGKLHMQPLRYVKDCNRDEWFADRGMYVLRVPAADVLRNATGVVDRLYRIVAHRASSIGQLSKRDRRTLIASVARQRAERKP